MWLVVHSQVELGVKSLKIGLNGWQHKILRFGVFELGK
jgi:hypothetical protein